MKHKILSIPLLDIPIVLAVGNKNVQDSLVALAKKYGTTSKLARDIIQDNLSLPAAGACFFDDESGIGMLWFPTAKPSLSTQSHEITHIVDYVLMYIGATTEMEFRAYMDEHLTVQLPHYLKKFKL